jgi:hypothetical protein
LVSANSGPDVGCAGDSMAVTLVLRHFGQGGGVCFMISHAFLYPTRLLLCRLPGWTASWLLHDPKGLFSDSVRCASLPAAGGRGFRIRHAYMGIGLPA